MSTVTTRGDHGALERELVKGRSTTRSGKYTLRVISAPAETGKSVTSLNAVAPAGIAIAGRPPKVRV